MKNNLEKLTKLIELKEDRQKDKNYAIISSRSPQAKYFGYTQKYINKAKRMDRSINRLGKAIHRRAKKISEEYGIY